MDSDLSLIEISREDDSLLHLQLQSDDVVTNATRPYFACSPLQKSHSKPAFVGSMGNGDAEKIGTSSFRGSDDKENVNVNKSEMPKLNVEPQQMKRKKKGGYNLRKSLAWDRAFFTEEGVLDPLELSMISGNVGTISGGKLSIIHEEGGESPLECLDRESDPAGLLILEEKPLKELATSTPNVCKQVVDSTPQKHHSVTASHKLRASAAKRKILSNHDMDRSGSKRSSCPQPVATQKRPANVNSTNKAAKELKVLRMPVRFTGSVLPKSTFSADSITSCSKNAQTVVTSQKNVRQKVDAGNKKKVQSKVDVHVSKPSTVKSTLRVSQKTVGKAIHKETSSSKVSNNLEEREGLVKPPVCDALADKRSSNVEQPLPHNANQNATSKQPVQSQIAKPSGLRMPSPSLGFFGQAKDSATQSLLPRYGQSGLAPQFSISNLRNPCASKSCSEKRSTRVNERIQEVVKTVKSNNMRMRPKAGGSVTLASNPDLCQKEHAEVVPVKSEKKSPTGDAEMCRDKTMSLPHLGPIPVSINNDNRLEDVASRGRASNGIGSATTTENSLVCIPQTAGVSGSDGIFVCQPVDGPFSLCEDNVVCPEPHLADVSPCRALSATKIHDGSLHDTISLSVGRDELLMSSGSANHATNEKEQMMQKDKVMLLEDGLSEKFFDTCDVQRKDVNLETQDGSATKLERHDGQILPEFTASTEVPCASESNCQKSLDDGAGIENAYLEGISSSKSYSATPSTLMIAEPCINSSYGGVVELSPFDCKLYNKNQSHQDSVKLGETASALLADAFSVDFQGDDLLMSECTVSEGSDGCGNGIIGLVECKPVVNMQSTAKIGLVIDSLRCTDVQSRNVDVLDSEDCLFNLKPSSVKDEAPTVVEITDSYEETKLESPNVLSQPESIVLKEVGVQSADATVNEAKEDAGYPSCVFDSGVSQSIQLGGGISHCCADIFSPDDDLMSHRPDSGQTVQHADQIAFQLREVDEPSPNGKSSTPLGQIQDVEITDSYEETKLESSNILSQPESIVLTEVGVRPADATMNEAKEDAGYPSCVIDSNVSQIIQLGGGISHCCADIFSPDDDLMSHRPDSGQTVVHADQIAFQLREFDEPSPNGKSSTPLGQIQDVEITHSYEETKLESSNVLSQPESIVLKEVGVRPADATMNEVKEDAGYPSCVIDSDVSQIIQLRGGISHCCADIFSLDDDLMSHRPDSGQTVLHADQIAFQLREVVEPSPNGKSSTPLGQIQDVKEGNMTYITSDLKNGGVNEEQKVQSMSHEEDADRADENNDAHNYICMRPQEEQLLNKNAVVECCNNLSYATEREQFSVVSRSETESTQQHQIQEVNACPQTEAAAKDRGSDFHGMDKDQLSRNEMSASQLRKMANSQNELMEVQNSEEICDMQISEAPGMAEGSASSPDRQSTQQHQLHPPFITDENKSAVEHDSHHKEGSVLHAFLYDVAKEEKISSDACQGDGFKIESLRANACPQVETEPQDICCDVDKSPKIQLLEDGMPCSKDITKQTNQERRRDVHISEEMCEVITPKVPSIANCGAPYPGNVEPLEAQQPTVCNLLETIESNISPDLHNLKMGRHPKDENQTVPKEISMHNEELDAIKVKPPPDAVPFSDEWLAAFEAAGEDILAMKSGKVQNSPPDKPQPEPGPYSPVRRKKNQEIGPYDCTKFTNVNVDISHSCSQ